MDIEFNKGRIDKDELKQAIEEKEVKVVEVMPASEYENGHIKSALNIEPSKIKDLAPKLLKKDDNIVVYCKDLTCLQSPFLVRWLRERGYNKVLDYEEGKTDWKAAGYPMDYGKQP